MRDAETRLPRGDEMRASVIIPTYNMCAELDSTLSFLGAQELGEGDGLEVIVVDDGSADATESVAGAHARALPLTLLRRPRDHLSCRARARNLGLNQAAGELCIFLDSGMLVEPNFVRAALAQHRLHPDAVLLHETLGLYAAALDVDRQSLTPQRLRSVFGPRVTDAAWLDIRQGLFEAVNDDLSRLPAPWALGWSCALSVPTRQARDVHGYDEDFLGWGAEDIDFSYRLMRAGARFANANQALCVHIPHPRLDEPRKRAQHVTNKLKLHRRGYELETELNVLLGGIACNLLVLRLERLALLRALPDVPAAPLGDVRRVVGQQALLVGCSASAAIDALAPASVLVSSQRELERLGREHPGVRVARSFGCITPYADGEFDAAILMDELRLYPRDLQVARLRECARVARTVWLSLTTRDASTSHSARARAADGWGWSAEAELRAAVELAGCSAAVEVANDEHRLYRIARSGRSTSSGSGSEAADRE
jgi:glycosyltransferase involved in cell wall biosynthesis